MLRLLICSWHLVALAGCANTKDDPPPAAGTANSSSQKPSTGTSSDFSQELDTDQAKRLIPKAASLSREEFQQILTSTPVGIDEIPNQSLTALLLAIDPMVAEEQNPKSRWAFHYVGTPHVMPDSEEIRRAVIGSREANFVSIIQPEYITNCTAVTKGDRAEGRVAFRAEALYVGEAKFTAERRDGKWRIVEFRIPEYLLTTKRRPDGTWELVSEEMLLGIAWP